MRQIRLFVIPFTNYEHKQFHAPDSRNRHWGGVSFTQTEAAGLIIGKTIYRPEVLMYTSKVWPKDDWAKVYKPGIQR